MQSGSNFQRSVLYCGFSITVDPDVVWCLSVDSMAMVMDISQFEAIDQCWQDESLHK